MTVKFWRKLACLFSFWLKGCQDVSELEVELSEMEVEVEDERSFSLHRRW
jgi:hypothetical protein